MGYAGGLYDLVAKCLLLPSSRTVERYTTHSNTVIDGILSENLFAAKAKFDSDTDNVREQKGGTNTIGMRTDAEDYIRPLPKRKR